MQIEPNFDPAWFLPSHVAAAVGLLLQAAMVAAVDSSHQRWRWRGGVGGFWCLGFGSLICSIPLFVLGGWMWDDRRGQWWPAGTGRAATDPDPPFPLSLSLSLFLSPGWVSGQGLGEPPPSPCVSREAP